ncbi:type II secretion system F family protein [Humibacter ginsenosidimutans]|uniref:type II secretion system F family protein n=1 Tax=Humibacter ginsenosidimutans TaxID=2599293 RepID=UPI001AEFAF0E|nr:type II secretion system F family protein [Humibacter ginsenosidimutans]
MSARQRHGARRPAVEAVADIAQRLAVLLAAGVPPGAAWGYLLEAMSDDEEGVSRSVLASASEAGARGGDVPRAIASSADLAVPRRARRGRRPDETEVLSAWRGLAAALQVATEAGSPLANALRDLATALRDLGQAQRDREAAMAGPRATARMVIALPVIGILFGAGLGFDTMHVLFATPIGIALLLIGASLLLAAGAWNRALLRRSRAVELLPGLAMELVAVAMSGGGSAAGAVDRVTGVCARFGLAPPVDRSVASVLTLSERAGVGAVELLHAEADQERRDARGAAQTASAALGVRLMLPLAVCVLPAFMVLSVAPLVLSILSSTVQGI